MKVWYLPIEPLAERYTEQMERWVVAGLERRGHEVEVIHPASVSDAEESDAGQFLNWAQRVRWSTGQVQELARRWAEVRECDRIFVGDLWHPGLSGIRYLSYTTGKDVGIFAVSYAGPFDPDDYLADAVGWAGSQEVAWMNQIDGTFVGSNYHRRLVIDGAEANGTLLRADRLPINTGLVWGTDEEVLDSSFLDSPYEGNPTGARTVIWPHRLAPEKRPELFMALAQALRPKYPDVRWVVSSGRQADERYREHLQSAGVELVVHSKRHYYSLLRNSCLMISTALQETWGYTLREAAALSTPVLAPDAACYPEFLQPRWLWQDEADLYEKVARHLSGAEPIAPLALPPNDGLERMIQHMEEWMP